MNLEKRFKLPRSNFDFWLSISFLTLKFKILWVDFTHLASFSILILIFYIDFSNSD